MKYAIILCTLLFATPQLNAQNNSAHHLGLHAGSTTGMGFSYRYWPSKFGFQVTGIPIFGSNHDSFISGGLSFLYTFKDNDIVDLYGYVGNHLILETNEYNYDYDYQTGLYKTDVITRETYNIGFGFGLKIKILEVLNLNFQAGYGLYNLTKNVNTNIAGEFGLYYNF